MAGYRPIKRASLLAAHCKKDIIAKKLIYKLQRDQKQELSYRKQIAHKLRTIRPGHQ